MFTWICPKCGGEVPPSYNECPRCTGQTSAASPAPTSPSPAPHRPLADPRPISSTAPPEPDPPTPRPKQVSPAVIAIGAAIGIVALLAVLYLWVLPRRTAATVAEPTPIENAGAGSAHPMAKHLEVTGVRLREGTNGEAVIQLLVVNHSGADLPDMQMDVTLSAGGKDVFSFPMALPSVGPYEYKELTAKVKTDLKPYELPDWQALRARFQLRD